jgi:type IV pilus assembly protein PilA
MLNKLRERAQDEKGFTLIELLVVILIIGILAAIALPAFLSQRGKAQDTDAKSKARTAETAFETQYTDAQAYSGDETTLEGIEPALNDGPAFTAAADADGQGYTITVTSKTGNTFTITKDNQGNVTHTCVQTTSKGGCPDSVYTVG